MIDDTVLARQRIGVAKRVETKCNRCGGRTTDKTGVCVACRRIGMLSNVRRMTTEQVASLLNACRSELQRRRDELNAAIGDAPPAHWSGE